MEEMITQVQDYIARDWYIRREARYDVKAIASVLTDTYPGMALDAIDGDAVWDVMQANVICHHEPVAGSMMFVVHMEDLADIAQGRDAAKNSPVECAKCEAWFSPDVMAWIS